MAGDGRWHYAVAQQRADRAQVLAFARDVGSDVVTTVSSRSGTTKMN
jgi:hypothetical protein